MKIVIYCQHVLGIGHFFRVLEIARALSRHQVTLVTGGEGVEVPLPPHVTVFALPPLMMDAEFRELLPAAAPAGGVEKPAAVAALKEQRAAILLDFMARESPDLFLVELYPFGRKAFRFELDPVLEAIRKGRPPSCTVVCSLRDILVEKKDPQAFEARVASTLNRYFDALLVHADPRLISLAETFSRLGDLAVPVVYTGFVAPRPPASAARELRRRLGAGPDDRLVVASAGGGRVGFRLLKAVLAARERLPGRERFRLQVFAGPFMEPSEYDTLRRYEGERVRISRFTPDLTACLAAADLSVSLAGYNTCMDILAAGVPALVWPFARNREQRMRAVRLAELDAFRLLEDGDLEPERLAGLMAEYAAGPRRSAPSVDLEGARFTASWIENWFAAAGGNGE